MRYHSKSDLLTEPAQKHFTARGLETIFIHGATLLDQAVGKDPVSNQKKQSLKGTCRIKHKGTHTKKSNSFSLFTPHSAPKTAE